MLAVQRADCIRIILFNQDSKVTCCCCMQGEIMVESNMLASTLEAKRDYIHDYLSQITPHCNLLSESA